MSQPPSDTVSRPHDAWSAEVESHLAYRLYAHQHVNSQHFRPAEVDTPQHTASPPSTVGAHAASTVGALSTIAESTVADSVMADSITTDVVAADEEVVDINASDSEDDSMSTMPPLSEGSTHASFEESSIDGHPLLQTRHTPLFDPYTNEMSEDRDGKSRFCMFWFDGCKNRFTTCQKWFECSKAHMQKFRKSPPGKVACKSCNQFRHGGADQWERWQTALQHMWDEHVVEGDIETLFGDAETDKLFIRWLHSNKVIVDADYKTLLQNPFSQAVNPVTATERRGDRRDQRRRY